jgi:SOS response regulatory protein OraA/RecX
MGLGRINAALTRWILRWLQKRAHTRNELEQLLAQAGFAPANSDITESLTGLEIRLRK